MTMAIDITPPNALAARLADGHQTLPPRQN
jgi:hypothetical protein